MTPLFKRVMFRSHHMGSNENDILFGSFARDHLAQLSVEQLLEFEKLLAENDTDLYDWMTAKRPLPDDLKSDLTTKIMAHIAKGKAQL